MSVCVHFLLGRCHFGTACSSIHGQAPCRFGFACSRADCVYLHPDGRALDAACSDSQQARKKRLLRFPQDGSSAVYVSMDAPTEAPLQGESQTIEKSYQRTIGGFPLAEHVRSSQVLEKAFHRTLQTEDYAYVSDQLRAVRQDLTVQHIRSPFAALVWEQSAVRAAANADWATFDSCLPELAALQVENGLEHQEKVASWRFLRSVAAGAADVSLLENLIRSPAAEAVWAVAINRAIVGGNLRRAVARAQDPPSATCSRIVEPIVDTLRLDLLLQAVLASRRSDDQTLSAVLAFPSEEDAVSWVQAQSIPYPLSDDCSALCAAVSAAKGNVARQAGLRTPSKAR
mmetsp:Transcript_50075/g.132000  ORF Transcript_50075/g.132000 Transcript_50075/m.132000 type:complete len:343 (+) Transcript_50075:146-1174(+)